MAKGRRDYTWGFQSESAVEGRYTESFVESFSYTVLANAAHSLYSYTVPEGYTLVINKLHIASDSRMLNAFIFTVGAVNIISGYFSELYSFSFSDQNPLKIAAGVSIYITGINNDEVASGFNGTLIGVLEQITE